MMPEQVNKAALRVDAKQARASMSVAARDDASFTICNSLQRHHTFQRAKCVAIYLATDSEVSCWPLIERAWSMKKRIFAPIVKKNRTLQFCELRPNSAFRRNRYNIAEPIGNNIVHPQTLDLVIAPLLAFDNHGNRLGMGGGFYDRTFSFLRQRDEFRKPKLAGVGFDCQRYDKVPASPWDIRLFQVFTESGPAY